MLAGSIHLEIDCSSTATSRDPGNMRGSGVQKSEPAFSTGGSTVERAPAEGLPVGDLRATGGALTRAVDQALAE